MFKSIIAAGIIIDIYIVSNEKCWHLILCQRILNEGFEKTCMLAITYMYRQENLFKLTFEVLEAKTMHYT